MIEEKLLHLTQRQRDEVEDFIDFMIGRDSPAAQSDQPGRDTSFVEIQERPEQVTHSDDAPSIFGTDLSESHNQGHDLLPDYPEYGEVVNSPKGEGGGARQAPGPQRRPAPKNTERDPGRLLDWVD